MPSLKEVRSRITSVHSTRQITSAMKMVSAAKLKKAQDAIVQMRPFAEKLTEILSNLSASLDGAESSFSTERSGNRILLVAFTSNRGLCGAFNAQIIRKVRAEIEANPENEYSIVGVGKKAYEAYKKTSYKVDEEVLPAEFNALYDNVNFDSTAQAAQQIIQAYVDGHFDKVYLLYNQFKNAAVQLPQMEAFLPIVPPTEQEASSSVDYLFEPNKEDILEDLIPRALKTQFFKALLDSNASEHGARMTAMHKATDNASDLLKELKLTYNKARQAAITKEILEISAGAEALAD
ncbi:MAG: ATP synthase F1 subunit gamma [Leptolyngbya sp. SIO3F4]|nr:ATP synthase F1 subunit gamma [Leptolyngbya sp. SIO3F4]